MTSVLRNCMKVLRRVAEICGDCRFTLQNDQQVLRRFADTNPRQNKKKSQIPAREIPHGGAGKYIVGWSISHYTVARHVAPFAMYDKVGGKYSA